MASCSSPLVLHGWTGVPSSLLGCDQEQRWKCQSTSSALFPLRQVQNPDGHYKCTGNAQVVPRKERFSPGVKSSRMRDRFGGFGRPAYQVDDAQLDSSRKLEELEEMVEEMLRESEGQITGEVQALVDKLEARNPNPDEKARPDLFNGVFELLTSNAPGVQVGATLNLGRLTFGAFQPATLKARLDKTLNYVDEPRQSYSLEITITVQDEGHPPLVGTVTNAGTIVCKDDSRLWSINFKSSTLAPKSDNGQDMARWLELFKPANPRMDDRGVVSSQLPSLDGGFDITYLSDNMRITRGHTYINGKLHYGNRFIVKLLPQATSVRHRSIAHALSTIQASDNTSA